MIKRVLSLLLIPIMIFIALFSIVTPVYAVGTTYYVDSVNGNDSNNGTSASTAWQTLSKVNTVTFQPGDIISFKKGCTWSGTLNLSGNGTSGNVITVDSYGTGALPQINASTDNAINLIGESYWTIQNLSLSSSSKQGIFVEMQNSLVTDIIISGVTVTNTTASGQYAIMIGQSRGGHTALQALDGHFENVLIEDCYIYNCYGGIINGGNCAEDGVHPRNANFTIRNNYINSVVENGILLLSTNGGTVEKNRYSNGIASSTSLMCGIWSADCRNITFQYNEVSGTVSTAGDSGAYDLDWGNEYVTYQYNYAHDNVGDFIQTFALGGQYTPDKYYNRYNTVRYNLGFNNGKGFVWNTCDSAGGLMYDNEFYNNTIVTAPSCPYVVKTRVYGTGMTNIQFSNNIFYCWATPTELIYSNADEYSFDYNDWHFPYGFGSIYWAGTTYTSFVTWKTASGQEVNGITSDPKFVNAYGGEDAFRLRAGSPCIDSGTDVGSMGSYDYWGNSIPVNTNYDIGAYEGTGISDHIYYKGNDITIVGTYSASSEWPDGLYPASKAFDDNYSSSRWAAASGDTSNAWLQADFGGNVTFDKVVIYDVNSNVSSYKIQYWDGSSWVDAYTGSNLSGTKTCEFTPVTGSKVRLLMISVSSGAPSIWEMEVLNSELVAGKVYSASTELDRSNSASKAFDGDATTTKWSAMGVDKTNAWLQVDFGSDVTFNKVITKENGNEITSYKIQYWNGSSWQDASIGTTIGSSQTDIFQAVTGSKMRLLIVSASSTGPSIYEMQVYNMPNLAAGKTYSASTYWDSLYTPAKAFDANISTRWAASANDQSGAWLQVDFGANTAFSEVVLRDAGQNMTSFKIQYWDGSSWQDAYSYSGSAVTGTKICDFPSVTGSKARLYVVSTTGGTGGNPSIFEMEVHK